MNPNALNWSLRVKRKYDKNVSKLSSIYFEIVDNMNRGNKRVSSRKRFARSNTQPFVFKQYDESNWTVCLYLAFMVP